AARVALRSFPTRRSSDLHGVERGLCRAVARLSGLLARARPREGEPQWRCDRPGASAGFVRVTSVGHARLGTSPSRWWLRGGRPVHRCRAGCRRGSGGHRLSLRGVGLGPGPTPGSEAAQETHRPVGEVVRQWSSTVHSFTTVFYKVYRATSSPPFHPRDLVPVVIFGRRA